MTKNDIDFLLCVSPGLNLLANHGYLPRNGIVNAGQVMQAASEGFNMEPDLSGVLLFIAIAFSGNIETETFSIGGEDTRTYSPNGIGSRAAGPQYGLDFHSHCEGDASGTRADYFLANGDNHSGQPDRFRRFAELAKANKGSFGYDTANQFYAQNAKLSVENNPKLYFQGYTPIVVLGEYPFYAAFMSNGTYNAGGQANYDSLSSILGFQYDSSTDKFSYVPERYPENWYRRAIPYGVATPDGLITNLAATFAAGSINVSHIPHEERVCLELTTSSSLIYLSCQIPLVPYYTIRLSFPRLVVQFIKESLQAYLHLL